MLKKIAIVLASFIVSSCGITYYIYYELTNPEDATTISKQDALWSKSGKTPTRCIAAYPDSTGKIVYLMETINIEKIKDYE